MPIANWPTMTQGLISDQLAAEIRSGLSAGGTGGE